jgi:hypothetical protein
MVGAKLVQVAPLSVLLKHSKGVVFAFLLSLNVSFAPSGNRLVPSSATISGVPNTPLCFQYVG